MRASVEDVHAPFRAAIDMNGADALGPVDEGQLAAARQPDLMRDPFARRALIQAPMPPVAVDDPDAVFQRSGVVEQVVVIGAEHQMRDGVPLQMMSQSPLSVSMTAR